MAEMSFPYGSVNHDRRYKSSDFRAYYTQLIGNGVIYSNSNALKVSEGGGMNLLLGMGGAFIEGVGYRNTSELMLELDMSDGVSSRIDRVVIRNDYKSRRTYAAVLKGTCSARPKAAELTRNADTYEIAVADVLVAKGVVSITQADITDTRLDKDICGIVTGLIEQADTTEIYNQFEAYFKGFKEQTGISYAQFTEIMESYIESLKEDGSNLYNSYNDEISRYIADLKTKGDADLATLTQQLINFRDTNETKFLEWFERIKGVFSTDATAKLLLEIDKLNEQVADMESMLLSGKIMARLLTDDGKHLTDDMGHPLLADRPICTCNQ